MDIIAIVNQKGGIGKSTTAGAIAEALTRKKKKVLVIDADPQGNLSYVMNAETEPCTYQIMMKQITAAEAIQTKNKPHIIAACPELAGADKNITGARAEYRLKEALSEISKQYEYCIIDTPPALGILTINALIAAHRVIIPAHADIFSLQGISYLQETIKAVKTVNPELIIDGIVLTRYNARTILSKDIKAVMQEAATAMKTKLYTTTIRENVQIREAQTLRKGLFEYAPNSNGAKDYLALTNEILKKDKAK